MLNTFDVRLDANHDHLKLDYLLAVCVLETVVVVVVAMVVMRERRDFQDIIHIQ